MTKVGFIILTWNSEKCIGNCINSIFSLEADKFSGRILVVDNGSKDQTESEVQRRISAYTGKSNFICEIQKLGKNFGTTISRNVGFRQLMNTDMEYICVLDSDTIVNTNAILTLTDALKKDASIGIVGPRMKSKDGTYQHSGRNLPSMTEKILKVLPIQALRNRGECMETSVPEEGSGCVSVGYLLSACWMMRKTLPAEIGLLDEKIFYAPEDVEYCIRCQKAGYSVQYCYDAEIIHEWQRLSRKRIFSRHNLEHIKGLAYLYWKYRYLCSTKKLERSFTVQQIQKKEDIKL